VSIRFAGTATSGVSYATLTGGALTAKDINSATILESRAVSGVRYCAT
jgi:hypothetical protein